MDSLASRRLTEFVRMVRAAGSAGPQQRSIAHRRGAAGKCGEAGFTLLEIVCVLAIVAMVAAISLPRLPMTTSRPRLEAYAVEVAALLKADRNAAVGRRGAVEAVIDAPSRSVRSGSGAQIIQVPEDVDFDALLPQRCNGRPAFSTITFFATGMSCGGAVRLTRLGHGVEVRVNWLTGDVDIVAKDVF